MAIETVDSSNLAEYVAKRTTKGADITTGEQMVAAALKASPQVAATEDKPADVVITAGVETTADVGPDPGSQEPTAANPDKPKKNSFQDRIKELTDQKKELDEFAQNEYEARLQAQRRIDELEKQVQALKPKEEAPKTLSLPDPASYTGEKAKERYEADLQAYIDQRAELTLQTRQQAEAARKAEELLAERVQVARTEIEDFDDVIKSRSRSQTSVPVHITAAIRESEFGPQIAYELAKDPILEKIVYSMTPAKALLKLGQIEQKYEAKGKKAAEPAPAAITKTPETTRAPAPVPSLKTDSGTIPKDLTAPMNFSDYKRQRIQEMRRARR